MSHDHVDVDHESFVSPEELFARVPRLQEYLQRASIVGPTGVKDLFDEVLRDTDRTEELMAASTGTPRSLSPPLPVCFSKSPSPETADSAPGTETSPCRGPPRSDPDWAADHEQPHCATEDDAAMAATLAAAQDDNAAKDAALTAAAEAIAAKDAEIAAKDAEIAAKDAFAAEAIAAATEAIGAKDAEIAAKDAEIAAKDAEIAAKDAEIAAKDAEIAAKDASATEAIAAATEVIGAKGAEIAAKDAEIAAKDAALQGLRDDIAAMTAALAAAAQDGAATEQALHKQTAAHESTLASVVAAATAGVLAAVAKDRATTQQGHRDELAAKDAVLASLQAELTEFRSVHACVGLTASPPRVTTSAIDGRGTSGDGETMPLGFQAPEDFTGAPNVVAGTLPTLSPARAPHTCPTVEFDAAALAQLLVRCTTASACLVVPSWCAVGPLRRLFRDENGSPRWESVVSVGPLLGLVGGESTVDRVVGQRLVTASALSFPRDVVVKSEMIVTDSEETHIEWGDPEILEAASLAEARGRAAVVAAANVDAPEHLCLPPSHAALLLSDDLGRRFANTLGHDAVQLSVTFVGNVACFQGPATSLDAIWEAVADAPAPFPRCCLDAAPLRDGGFATAQLEGRVFISATGDVGAWQDASTMAVLSVRAFAVVDAQGRARAVSELRGAVRLLFQRKLPAEVMADVTRVAVANSAITHLELVADADSQPGPHDDEAEHGKEAQLAALRDSVGWACTDDERSAMDRFVAAVAPRPTETAAPDTAPTSA